jgi:putative SOS response-associated peptidase YedK
MCGRATLVTGADEIAEVFGVAPIPIGPPRFNLAPGQDLLVLRPVGAPSPALPPSPAPSPARQLAFARWGLVPWWSKDGKMSGKTIQARAETVARAPAFRDAFKSRRCLVVVDGFYEWSGSGKARQPHHVKLVQGGPFAIAGLWDSWRTPEGATLETCAVVTTAARGPVQQLHDRMPLMLGPEARDRWLSASPDDALAVLEAREPLAENVVVTPVSTWVNDVRHDDPRCLEPAAEPAGPAQTTLRFE